MYYILQVYEVFYVQVIRNYDCKVCIVSFLLLKQADYKSLTFLFKYNNCVNVLNYFLPLHISFIKTLEFVQPKKSSNP